MLKKFKKVKIAIKGFLKDESGLSKIAITVGFIIVGVIFVAGIFAWLNPLVSSGGGLGGALSTSAGSAVTDWGSIK